MISVLSGSHTKKEKLQWWSGTPISDDHSKITVRGPWKRRWCPFVKHHSWRCGEGGTEAPKWSLRWNTQQQRRWKKVKQLQIQNKAGQSRQKRKIWKNGMLTDIMNSKQRRRFGYSYHSIILLTIRTMAKRNETICQAIEAWTMEGGMGRNIAQHQTGNLTSHLPADVGGFPIIEVPLHHPFLGIPNLSKPPPPLATNYVQGTVGAGSLVFWLIGLTLVLLPTTVRLKNAAD